MEKNTKLIIGLGAVALAIYLFKDKLKGFAGGSSTQSPTKPSSGESNPLEPKHQMPKSERILEKLK